MAILVPTKVILHCSATKDTDSLSWEAIRRYHVDTLGWSDIGYHYGIEMYNGQLVYKRGRHPYTQGAHCKAAGRNQDSLGVCVVGEYDTVPPDQDRIDATVCFLANLCFVFNIKPEDVYGHREFEPMKTCPGKMWNMDLIRGEVEHAINEFQGWEI